MEKLIIKVYKGLANRIAIEEFRLEVLKTERNYQYVALDKMRIENLDNKIRLQNKYLQELYAKKDEYAQLVLSISRSCGDSWGQVFAYTIIADLPIKDVAKKLGVSEGTVRNIKSKLVKKCQILTQKAL